MNALFFSNEFVVIVITMTIMFHIINQSFQPIFPNSFQTTTKCVSYDPQLNLLTISCNSNMSNLYNQIANKDILNQESSGIWLLNASIMVSPTATLDINSSDTSWLKLLSNYNNPNNIHVLGSAAIDGVKITSWDSVLNVPIFQNSNGSIPRPYIMTEESKGTLNITNSEVGFIGYNDYPSNGFLYANGGNGSKLENNTFHDMWDGFYSDGVKNLTINNNTYFNNLRYGIDPHTGSHDLDITNNLVYNNTRIGIICALNCYNILFANNTVHDNGITGLMFAENTTNSTAFGNRAFNEEVGMSIFASSNNTLFENQLSSNKIGIFLGGNASDNYILNNKLENDPYGFYFSDLPFHNLLKNNDMTNITTAVPNSK